MFRRNEWASGFAYIVLLLQNYSYSENKLQSANARVIFLLLLLKT